MSDRSMNERPTTALWTIDPDEVSSPSRSAADARAVADDEDGTR
jgi:hypothetical protein